MGQFPYLQVNSILRKDGSPTSSLDQGIDMWLPFVFHMGWIVWINGTYPPGDWPDLNIA